MLVRRLLKKAVLLALCLCLPPRPSLSFSSAPVHLQASGDSVQMVSQGDGCVLFRNCWSRRLWRQSWTTRSSSALTVRPAWRSSASARGASGCTSLSGTWLLLMAVLLRSWTRSILSTSRLPRLATLLWCRAVFRTGMLARDARAGSSFSQQVSRLVLLSALWLPVLPVTVLSQRLHFPWLLTKQSSLPK